MKNKEILIKEYLNKINFAGECKPTLENLSKILILHAEYIPFGTLSCFMRENVSIDTFNIADKLIMIGREGYCLEQNTLLAEMLKELGFKVRSVLSRAYYGGLHDGIPPLIHLTNIVTIGDSEYLIDPSFGGITPTLPINLSVGDSIQYTALEPFRVINAIDSEIVPELLAGLPVMLQVMINEKWHSLYAFNPEQTAYPIDIELANWYVSTSKDPLYSRVLLVSRSTPKERFILHGLTMNIYSKEGVISNKLNNFEEFENIVSQKFNINTNEINNLHEIYKQATACA